MEAIKVFWFDTLSNLAQAYGTSQADLARAQQELADLKAVRNGPTPPTESNP